MSLKIGDKVVVITGKDKGNTGKIIKILKQDQKVLVEGINMMKKHLKADANNQNGGIVSREAPIHISNVKLTDLKPKTKPESDKKTTKTRVVKKNKEKID